MYTASKNAALATVSVMLQCKKSKAGLMMGLLHGSFEGFLCQKSYWLLSRPVWHYTQRSILVSVLYFSNYGRSNTQATACWLPRVSQCVALHHRYFVVSLQRGTCLLSMNENCMFDMSTRFLKKRPHEFSLLRKVPESRSIFHTLISNEIYEM